MTLTVKDQCQSTQITLNSEPMHLSCITQNEKIPTASIRELHGYINHMVHITMLLCRAASFTFQKKIKKSYIVNYWYQILTTHDALVLVSFFSQKTYIVNYWYQILTTHDALVPVSFIKIFHISARNVHAFKIYGAFVPIHHIEINIS